LKIKLSKSNNNQIKMEQIQIIENQGLEVFEAQERAAIDIQIATAKRYPRELQRVRNNSIAIVCMDKETAESCRYAKPVAGKKVVGASVHLARIVCQQYGNIRVQQRVKQITDRTIVAEAVAFDLETNYAVCVEARRSILTKDGQRFTESVIETNAMAILAIAERNAILKVIPKALIDAVYKEAFTFANGDLSDNAKLQVAINTAFEFFKTEYGATEEDVLLCLGLKTKEAIKAEHIADLRGYVQALKDKELTPEELFKREKNGSGNDIPGELKAEIIDKLAKCDNADEIDMLFDTLDDALRNNHFVKKLFAARKATVNVGFANKSESGVTNYTSGGPVTDNTNQTNKPSLL
jgi:hypothetical protein